MKFNAIGIVCSDISESLSFYRLLGVAFPDYEDGTGHYEAELGGGVNLMLDSEEVMASFIDGFEVPKGNDRISFAVECESSSKVDATYDELISQGHLGVKPPFDAFWNQRYATISDPDGNHIDLYAPLPS